jgi:hypothetical protein
MGTWLNQNTIPNEAQTNDFVGGWGAGFTAGAYYVGGGQSWSIPSGQSATTIGIMTPGLNVGAEHAWQVGHVNLKW